MRYQYFGSGDSTDIDVVFFVAELPATIQERSILCKALASQYFETNEGGKRVNANLAVLEKGCVVEVYKGTADELNNALYYTYVLHQQDFDNQVIRVLPRNTDLKFIRCARMLLSALTRTVFRKIVKQALQADLQAKIKALKQIDLQQLAITEKGFGLTDIKKLMAFQLGQTLALGSGKEVYTKQEIITCYPQLSLYLQRIADTNTDALAALLGIFAATLEERAKMMTLTEEEQYKSAKLIL